MLLIRRVRYGLVALAVLVVAWLLYQARGGLVPFVIGGILAYVLAPLVERTAQVFPFYSRRRELARTLAIVLIYLAALGVIGSLGAVIVTRVIQETTDFIEELPNYTRQARERSQEWTEVYRERVPENMQARVEAATEEFGQQAGQFGQQVLNRTFTLLTSTFSALLSYIIIPFWLFYVLKDRHKIGPSIQNWFPPGLRGDVDACIRIVQRVLGSYVRAQLILGVIVGAITTIGLWAIGVQGYVVLGLIAGVTELIPVIGPILGAIPAIIVTLATDPARVWVVVLLYLVVQQVENAFLVPRIQGNAVEMHPALIIVLLVVAQQLAGFFGMIIVVPLAAVARDLFKYIYRRLREREEELAHPRIIRVDRARLLAAASARRTEGDGGNIVVPDATPGATEG